MASQSKNSYMSNDKYNMENNKKNKLLNSI